MLFYLIENNENLVLGFEVNLRNFLLWGVYVFILLG